MARKHKIVWSNFAKEDLRQISAYISQDSPENACSFVNRLRNEVQTLRDFPEKLSVVPELGRPYREKLLGRYRIIYKVTDEEVFILAISHSARNFETAIGSRFPRRLGP